MAWTIRSRWTMRSTSRLVVLLRGVNVGGHRTIRPAVLAKALRHLGAVNIGAAGTFVFQRPVTRRQVRAELAQRLPFATKIVICDGREIVRLMSNAIIAPSRRPGPVVGFVSVLTRAPRVQPSLPMRFPARGEWMLNVLACDGRFVIGQYRRKMKAIGYLGTLDRVFGTPATTRNWNTMAAVVKALETDVREDSHAAVNPTTRRANAPVTESEIHAVLTALADTPKAIARLA